MPGKKEEEKIQKLSFVGTRRTILVLANVEQLEYLLFSNDIIIVELLEFLKMGGNHKMRFSPSPM